MARSPHYKHLRKKWAKKHADVKQKFHDTHQEAIKLLPMPTKKLIAGSMAGAMLLGHPGAAPLVTTPPSELKQEAPQTSPQEKKDAMLSQLNEVLPENVQELSSEQEARVGEILSNSFDMKVSAELEGKRLNRSYGYIGAEQHLMRYPGDTMASHFSYPALSQKYYSSGMAPGRGAWGYFANSQAEMTELDVQREMYYIAVQTFLAPGWKDDVRGHYQFFKYRKMLVVNPENGRALVADIGDAGPAAFTGKHLGGSPEVMKYLERVDGRAKGPVLYFFIDDPNDEVELGPVLLKN